MSSTRSTPPTRPGPTRREVLIISAGGSLGFFGGLLGLGALTAPETVPLPLPLLPAAELDARQVVLFPEHRLLLTAQGEGVALVSTTCTHLGCQLALRGRELVCPCHGGRYDLTGRVLAGPPPRDLPWLVGGVDSQGMVFVVPDLVDEARRGVER